MTMDRRILLSVGVLAALLTWYVLQQSAEQTGDKVRVAFFPNVGHAVPAITTHLGTFYEGTNQTDQIEVLLFDSGPQAIEALFSRSIDMAYVGPGPAINGFLKSEADPIRILVGAAGGGSSMIIHPDSDITAPEDLAGTRVAAPQIGNTQDISLRTYISDHGMDTAERGGEVVVLNIANPDIYTLFAKGEIDAAWVPEPWATMLISDLDGIRLFYEEDLWDEGTFASVILVAREDFVQNNPDVVQRWLQAHHATIEWINDNPEQARDAFNAYIEDSLGRPFPDHIVEESLANIQFTSDPLADTIDVFAQRAHTLGYLGRGDYNLDGLYYADLLQGQSGDKLDFITVSSTMRHD